MAALPILYIKPGCPWCAEAMGFLERRNVSVEVKDVNSDAAARKRMQEISGQSRTPTLEYGDFVCADFDTDELMAALNRRPEIRAQLGLDGASG